MHWLNILKRDIALKTLILLVRIYLLFECINEKVCPNFLFSESYILWHFNHIYNYVAMEIETQRDFLKKEKLACL